MPELPIPSHEKFVRNLLTEPSAAKAYQATYDEEMTNRVAASASSRLLTNVNIKDRFYELLRESKADLPQIRNRFAKWLNDDDAPTQSWDAVKTGLRIYGILDAEDASKTMQNVNISITVTGDTSDNNLINQASIDVTSTPETT